MPMFSYDTFVLEMYFQNNEELATWGEPPVSYQEYVSKNEAFLKELYRREQEIEDR
jgi:hypothetical protein